jgi:hypothetical protein
MLPKWHILGGFIVSYILVYFFHFSIFSGTIIFLSSFLIDVDHYLVYSIKSKDISIKNAYKMALEHGDKWKHLSYDQKKKEYWTPFIFHGIEPLAILLFLSYFNIFFLGIFIGFLTHMILDYIQIVYQKDPLLEKFSQIYIYFRNKNKNQVK